MTHIVPPSIDLAVAKHFRQSRIRLGLSQSELARHLDVRESTVLRWERGERPISRVVQRAMRDLETELRTKKGKR